MIGRRYIFHQKRKVWKKSELNDKSIALNIFYVPYNTKTIRHTYKSKYNKDSENQITLLMITDGKKGISLL